MAEEEKTNKFEQSGKKIKANAAAVGEWFKQAAWLQVILIVGVIFGLLLSIPAIVKCVQDQEDTSKFFKTNGIKYSQFNDFITGKKNTCNGLVGDGNLDGSESYSTSKEGFVILFYNDSDSTMTGDYQKNLEDAYDQLKTNNEIKNKTKFYTLNVSWVVGDTESENVGKNGVSYDNSFISLDEQKTIFESIKNVYLDQANYRSKYGLNENYVNSDISISKLINSTLGLDNAGSDVFYTIPSCFVTFVKNKNDNAYDINKPDKVIFTKEGNVSTSSKTDAIKQYMDLFNFKINRS